MKKVSRDIKEGKESKMTPQMLAWVAAGQWIGQFIFHPSFTKRSDLFIIVSNGAQDKQLLFVIP